MGSFLYLMNMRIKHNIRNSLRRHRLMAEEMTQQELAERVGVTRQTISSIEKGKYAPSVGLALLLARTFDVTVEAIFQLEREG